jgi:hypothetical protein
MGETNSPSFAHVGYNTKCISPLSRVKFKSLEWRNIVTHGQLKENLYDHTLLLTFLKVESN